MATNDELLARLAEAETALHKVTIGKQTVRLEYDNGKAVTYSPANVADLRSYIRDLQVQLGIKTGRSRAISVGF